MEYIAHDLTQIAARTNIVSFDFCAPPTDPFLGPKGFDEPLRRHQSMADMVGQNCLQQILFRPWRAVH